MSLHYLTLETSSRPKNLVIFQHGYGADANDLLSIGEEWAKTLPDTHFVSLQAPTPCEMGGPGFQWFSLSNWSNEAMVSGAESVRQQLLDSWKELIAKVGVTAERTVIVGFSQGTMMALYTAFNQKELSLGGVLGYSGAWLENIQKPLVEAPPIPVCLVHGEADAVVPVQASIQSSQRLEQLGVPVELLTIPYLAHGIDMQGLTTGLAFLKKRFA